MGYQDDGGVGVGHPPPNMQLPHVNMSSGKLVFGPAAPSTTGSTGGGGGGGAPTRGRPRKKRKDAEANMMTSLGNPMMGELRNKESSTVLQYIKQGSL